MGPDQGKVTMILHLPGAKIFTFEICLENRTKFEEKLVFGVNSRVIVRGHFEGHFGG